ncbi:MAG TPA: flagellin [Micromonosporaceae bacterium]
MTLGSGQATQVVASTAGVGVGRGTSSAYAKAAAVNSSGIAGLTATADTTVQLGLAAAAVANTVTDYDLSINGVAIYSNYNATVGGSGPLTADQVVAAINANSSGSGVTATYDSSNSRVTLTASDGSDIIISQGNTVTANQGLGATGGTNNTTNPTAVASSVDAGAVTNGSAAAAAGHSTQITFTGSIRLTAAQGVTVAGAGVAKIGFAATSYALGNSALNSASVTTVAGANTTIGRVDAALTTVSGLRSTLGAIQNRFDSTIASLSAVSENLSASRSRILDADFAAETANLTKAQILQQAGIAILAQANSAPQAVLALLK